ncbi:MAG: S9 family peptidase [Egibacteraceae bacterium]
MVFTADDRGHTLPFRVELATDAVTRLATQGAFDSLCVAPDGTAVYALRSAIDRPPQAVVLDAHAPEQEPRALPTPGADTVVPATVHRLEATAADGTSVPSWLVLPPGATARTPAPLVVWVHGGPVASWTGWHWRWNPHVLVERGYAVLMPDPALSTGYGHGYIARGWGRWGAEPYTDLLAAVDGACGRADVDHGRTALMGGSFGGYMANWVAGHTDRFACIVTHASLWDLGQFHGSTDLGVWWEREFGDPYTDPARYAEHSPAGHVDRIRTPMLVIHGDRDYRVPVGEALKLWTDLSRHGVEAKFLSFPDEHHWILKPANIRLWYETALAFLDHHVRGRPWRRPDLL